MVKKLLNNTSILAILLSIALLLLATVKVDASTLTNRNALDSNQDWLYLMYSNNDGCYFLQPTFETENVIFIDFKDMENKKCSKEHHGTKYIGTFIDDELWELEYIEKYNSKKKMKKMKIELN